MISTQFILNKLGEHYIGCSRISYPGFIPERQELIFDQEYLHKDKAYFCTQEDLRARPLPRCDDSTAVFVCGCSSRMDPQPLGRECCAFLLSCSLAQAQNIVLRASDAIAKSRDKLQSLIAQGGNAHQFITALADMVDGDAMLLDQDFSVIFTSELSLGGALQNSLSDTGQIPEKVVSSIVLSTDRYKGNVGVKIFRELGTAVFSARAVSSDGLSVTLLLEKNLDPGIDVFGLMSGVHEMLERWLFSGGYAAATRIYTSFQKCWDRIRSGESDNDSELRDVFAGLPHPITGEIRIGAIRFRTPRNIPYNYILARLRNIDSDMNVAINNSDIVLVIPDRLFDASGRSEKVETHAPLLKLLEDFDAYMMYGNFTGRPKHIPEVFFLTRRVLIIASKLDPEKRIFFYEDYASYGAIDLAAQSYLKSDAAPNAYMLINPNVLALAIYDKEHGDDLKDVLFYYLAGERNVKKTAETMHMHRNTVLNKLKKIEEMTELDLENYQLRQRLLFSCQFIKYYEKVLELRLPVKVSRD